MGARIFLRRLWNHHALFVAGGYLLYICNDIFSIPSKICSIKAVLVILVLKLIAISNKLGSCVI
jgi:hypothetical protein